MKDSKKNYDTLWRNPKFATLPMNKIKFLASIGVVSLTVASLQAQVSSSGQQSQQDLSSKLNTVSTMVPFLTISPDSRSASMGDAGVALFNPDANSAAWNNANLTFAQNKTGFSMSYAPWLRQLVDDVGFSYLSGYTKFGKNSAISGSFRYFSLGNINFTDFEGLPTGNFNPNEFALDVGYATKFSDKFAMGVNLRYIYSNLVGSGVRNGIDYSPGTSIAGDISLIYRDEFRAAGKKHRWNLGMNIQNIGAKMTYSSQENRDFIPTNLKLGVGYQYEIDDHNELFIYLDVNKLLVPTPPYYLVAMSGQDSLDSDGNKVFIGQDPNVTPVQGMIQSFYDAPGGFSEELNEWTPSIGFEYLYEKTFALRGGVFYEANTKGARQYMTLGLGMKFESLALDASYLIPFANRHPLQNQLRFSLLLDMAAITDEK